MSWSTVYPCNVYTVHLFRFYLRQVNGVNGGDVFVRCVYVYVCVQQTGESDQFKTAKTTDFKFDEHVLKDNPDITLKNL